MNSVRSQSEKQNSNPQLEILTQRPIIFLKKIQFSKLLKSTHTDPLPPQMKKQIIFEEPNNNLLPPTYHQFTTDFFFGIKNNQKSLFK
jgi:hypothetical protein